MKNKILNILIIVGYSWLSIALLYSQLPLEYQELVPFINKDFLIFSGATTGAISAVIQYLKHVMNQNSETNLKSLLKFDNLLIEQAKKIKEQGFQIDNLKNVVEQLTKIKEEDNEKQKEIIKLLKINNNYAKLELQSKVTNPLIDKEIKEQIEKVFEDEEQSPL